MVVRGDEIKLKKRSSQSSERYSLNIKECHSRELLKIMDKKVEPV
jgi:hypothetical protein